MVFIQSQEYIDSFGKPSKNIICLEGQTDYKISHNPETGKFDVRIVVGDFEKYIFSTENEGQCTKILQNIFTHHSTKDAFAIYDVNAFMIPEIEEETTIEEIEELIIGILKFHGYENVAVAWDAKIEEMYEEQEQLPLEQNEKGELSLTNPLIEQGVSSPITTTPPLMSAAIEQRYIHYN